MSTYYMHYDCSAKNEEVEKDVAYTLKLPFEAMQKLVDTLNRNETCEISFESEESEKNGVLVIDDKEYNIIMKDNPFVTEVAVLAENSNDNTEFQYKYDLNGVIQPRFTKDEIKKPTEISIHSEKEKEKIIEQDMKNTVFLNQIKKKGGIDDTTLYNHCFHYLLFHMNESLDSLVEGVITSIRSNNEFPSLSSIDITRIQLQIVSLCTIADNGLLSIKPSLLKDLSISSWSWIPEEKSKLQFLLKSQQKREAVEEAPAPKKRARKTKQVENDDDLHELELIIPNHSINLTINLLTKEIKQNMEEHLKLFEKYTPELEGNVEVGQLLDLHARCLVLKRILDKKIAQHLHDLEEIDKIRETVPESDSLLVDEYKRRIIDKREDELQQIDNYVIKQFEFLKIAFPSLYSFCIC